LRRINEKKKKKEDETTINKGFFLFFVVVVILKISDFLELTTNETKAMIGGERKGGVEVEVKARRLLDQRTEA